jgi:uncharacterized membrane protein YkvA (DUF1232 family)
MGVLRQTAAKIKKEFAVYRLVLKHPKTPMLAKILLGLAVGYILLPFDLIPDFIPVIGQLDDLVIVPALVYAALKLIPAEIVESCRKELENQHG